MPTKAQLEEEIRDLRQQLQAPAAPQERSGPPADEEDTDRSEFAKLLEAQGIDTAQIEALWAQFSEELGDLPQNKPLLTAIAAFGLGFTLGRLSKS